MTTVVIVDDEKIVVEWIRTMLNRSAKDLQVVGTAYNGIRGVAVIRQMKPDIVITDIRIPGLDGLSLIEHTMKELPMTAYIVISGYCDFSYARQALRLSVLDYVDKPITEDKLLAAIATARNYLEEKKRLRASAAEGSREDYNAVCQQTTETLIQYLKEENSDDMLEYVEQALENMERMGLKLDRFQDEWVKNIYVAMEVLRERNPQFEFHKNIVPYGEIKQLHTPEEVRLYTMELFREFAAGIQTAEKTPHNRTLQNLLSYIDEHYREEIGLTELAEYLHMNPTYLSMLFKDYAGMSYIKYLTKVRMDKARELLREGYRVTDVSEMVGYKDYRYFTQVFKKTEHMTPNQYKEKYRV